MNKHNFITIENVNDKACYIIKDNCKMTIGKMDLIEYSINNKSCTFRMHFYRNERRNEYLTYTLENFTSMLFNTRNIYKINILIKDDTEIQPFLCSNFHIEGILTNNIISDLKSRNEILLGVDYAAYKKLNKLTLLSLNGNNINLRILIQDDAKNLLNYYKNNKEHLKNFEELKDNSFYTLENQIMLIRQQYIELLNGHSVFFGIFKDENIIGVIQLYNIVWGMFNDATIGYSIDKDEQGKGYAKEAVNLTLEYAFNILNLHRIQAATLVDNIKSKNVLKTCGFKEIGISKKYLFINGDWKDHYIFYKLNEKI
ncbi:MULTISPECIES: GNAT family N-acetyltransferase [Clostridium]|uniref:GNAT family N-acetyltransferase n=1 Tax=Clostridium TaxID=1485 RepID=UPI0008243B3B|nr:MULTISPECIES: GNAT family protein [Clostridium]PJI06786.1 GNAT family N-acetyltransferase [Clostridium sp. CT7]